MRQKFDALFRQGFVRSVGVLAGGTALAQLISVLALPLITRLYTPADFSVLAVFVSILSTITVVACLRLEIAIPLPESDADAANLFVLAFLSGVVVSIFTGFGVWLFPDEIVKLVREAKVRPYLWLLPLGVLIVCSYASLQFWAIRKKRFGVIAKTRMMQVIGGIGTQVGLGWAAFTPFGLLLGHIMNSGAGMLSFARSTLREDSKALQSVNWPDMRRLLREYDRFPKYSTFEIFLNNAGVQLPILIIASMAVGPQAGYLILATRAIASPMGLIGGAVSQVYLSQASDKFRSGLLPSFTLKIIGGLVKIGVGPLIFIGILAPVIFPIVFGAEWHRAGEIVVWMTPWFIMQLLVSPLSTTLHVMGQQRIALMLNLFGFVLRVGAVCTAGWLVNTRIVEVYAVSSCIFYGIHLYVIMVLFKIKISSLYKIFLSNLIVILTWTIFGVVLNLFIRGV